MAARRKKRRSRVEKCILDSALFCPSCATREGFASPARQMIVRLVWSTTKRPCGRHSSSERPRSLESFKLFTARRFVLDGIFVALVDCWQKTLVAVSRYFSLATDDQRTTMSKGVSLEVTKRTLIHSLSFRRSLSSHRSTEEKALMR